MKSLVIATFPTLQAGKLEELKQLLEDEIAGDTRAFDGCISIDVHVEKDTETIHLIEYWESLDHYEAYLQWRIENGLAELLNPILEGGAEGLKIIKCGQKEDI